MSVVEASGICKTFAGPGGEVRAVDAVDFKVDSGDFVALYGPSGCGKSTLLMITGGLLHPDAGTLKINGQDPYALDANERAAFRAQHIGFVFQQFHLIPYLSVLDNVLLPTLASQRQEAAARAGELLERFQLAARLDHVPSALSVGEQQRVALARALLHEPALLLADEPTGNLDPENAEVILEYMHGFADQGGAVLMVTHDDRAKAAAGRQLELRDGTFVV